MLRAKEKIFAYYFHKLRNVREAAIKAGYSSFFAEKNGTRLISRKDVKEYIAKLDEKQKEDTLYFDVVSGLKRLAFGEVNDGVKLMFKNEEEANKYVDELNLFNVSEIKKPKENSLEIKFFDRYKALEILCKLMETDQGKKDVANFYTALENSVSANHREDLDD